MYYDKVRDDAATFDGFRFLLTPVTCPPACVSQAQDVLGPGFAHVAKTTLNHWPDVWTKRTEME
jgi:hypothetical protein